MNRMTKNQIGAISRVLDCVQFGEKLIEVDTSSFLPNGDVIVNLVFKGEYMLSVARGYHFVISKKGNLYFYNNNCKKQYVKSYEIHSKCRMY